MNIRNISVQTKACDLPVENELEDDDKPIIHVPCASPAFSNNSNKMLPVKLSTKVVEKSEQGSEVV